MRWLEHHEEKFGHTFRRKNYFTNYENRNYRNVCLQSQSIYLKICAKWFTFYNSLSIKILKWNATTNTAMNYVLCWYYIIALLTHISSISVKYWWFLKIWHTNVSEKSVNKVQDTIFVKFANIYLYVPKDDICDIYYICTCYNTQNRISGFWYTTHYICLVCISVLIY